MSAGYTINPYKGSDKDVDDLLAELEAMFPSEEDFGTADLSESEETKKKILDGRDLPAKKVDCTHSWKSVLLVFNSVTICKHCGEKK